MFLDTLVVNTRDIMLINSSFTCKSPNERENATSDVYKKKSENHSFEVKLKNQFGNE